MTLYVLAQVVGFLGSLFVLLSFQKNTNKGILFLQLIGGSFFAVHFILLEAYTGAAMGILGVARNFVFFNREKRWAKSIIWLYLFIFIYVITGLITWENRLSALPVIAITFGTIALWVKDPRLMRFIMLPAPTCWLVYNIANSSISGIVSEVFLLASLIVAIFRFDIIKADNLSK